jgi:low temperature requirement protein LtrA
VLREGERVLPLELFFDLVFVLAITQCTALMVHQPSWEGVAKATLVLSLLWWCWVGYAWLTSVIDPEEGPVRIVMFVAMAALLVIALSVQGAFSDRALTVAVAYGVVRAAHIALFLIASRDEPQLRHSVMGLAISTAIGVTLIVGAAFLDSAAQGAVWALALLLDYGGPALFGAQGWKLMPEHFVERHRLIVIIALGESIVAFGVGADVDLTTSVLVAVAFGMALICSIWWAYFDVVTIVAERRLVRATPGREQNTLARDSYSFIHLPMILGIVFVAMGIEESILHLDERLHAVPAFALAAGYALYLLAHVAFRLRNVGTVSWRRLVAAAIALALLPLLVRVDALAALGIVAALAVGLITYEVVRFAEARDRVRHRLQEDSPTN